MELISRINDIAKKKNALIVAHNYQPPEIQDIARYTGDSLELSRIAADTDAAIIVFCGVHFMAESALILSPGKKVILPVTDAGCPMADMASAEELMELKKLHPDAAVVTYINSSAEVKALSDICCTSANAVDIVRRLDAGKIIFVPDKNLGSYVRRFTDKEIILWKGYCPAHDRFSPDEFMEVKRRHPDAVTMVHPECRPEVVDMADEVFSTGGMVKFVRTTAHRKIIVGTEIGMIHKLKSVAPEKEYIPASASFICEDMKKITLENLNLALEREEPVITLSREVIEKSRTCLTRMLELSK